LNLSLLPGTRTNVNGSRQHLRERKRAEDAERQSCRRDSQAAGEHHPDDRF
jgi:hypothetical protein